MRDSRRAGRRSRQTKSGPWKSILIVVGIACAVAFACFVYPPLHFKHMLRRISKGPDSRRKRAAGDIAGYGEKAVPPLMEIMKSGDDRSGRYAAMALANIGATEEALGLLGSDRPQTRINAIRVLARIEDKKARAAVIGALIDEDPHVRQIACRWIEISGIDEGFDGVLNLVGDPEKDVRNAAVQTLGEITDGDRIPVLLDTAAGHEDADVREDLVSILTSGGFSQHRVRVLSEAEARYKSAGAEAALVYIRLASALRGDPGRRILVDLVGHENGRVRTEAVRAVWRFGLKDAVPGLMKVLKEDAEGRPCEEAGKALSKLGDRETQTELLAATHSKDEFRRYAAITALFGAGRESAVPRAVEMLDDKSDRVVKQTHRTLLAIAEKIYAVTPKTKPTRPSWEDWLKRADDEVEQMKAVDVKMKEIKKLLFNRTDYKRAGELVSECEKTLGEVNRKRLVTPMKSINRRSEALRLWRYQAMKMQPLTAE